MGPLLLSYISMRLLMVIPLDLLRRSQLVLVHLKELVRLCGLLTRHVAKASSRDVVSLTLANQTVVFEDVRQFRLIALRLRLENPLCLGSVHDGELVLICVQDARVRVGSNLEVHVLRYVLKLHFCA